MELSLNMEIYDLIHILLLLLLVLVEIKIDSKTEATNSDYRNIWEKKVEIMGNGFSIWHTFSVFQVPELLISSFFQNIFKTSFLLHSKHQDNQREC